MRCFICGLSGWNIREREIHILGLPDHLPICDECVRENQCPGCMGDFRGKGEIFVGSRTGSGPEICPGCNGTGKYHYSE
ncbi:MAG: hypothetical protein HY769_04975 [Candidatus Stahlbacteria bacterium]|nr:hypothetical protein [Candidatus Stahlbacteria bacterium]